MTADILQIRDDPLLLQDQIDQLRITLRGQGIAWDLLRRGTMDLSLKVCQISYILVRNVFQKYREEIRMQMQNMSNNT